MRLFSRRQIYDDLAEEIRQHLEERVEALMAEGTSREDAEHTARREFGNVALIEEHGRETWQWPRLETIWIDVKYALLQLWKSPGFAAICLTTLCLGIGANTAVFSMIQAVLLCPLPYHDPNRLVLLADPQDPTDGGILYKDFETWKQKSQSFTEMAVYYRDSGWSRITLTGSQEPESVQGAFASANLFRLLGVAPLSGRTFTPEEEMRRERVVVLSYGLWQRRFGGSPDVIGQKIKLDGETSEVIGVMPESFQFPARDAQLWAPITTNRYWNDPTGEYNDGLHSRGFYARWQAIARLKEEVSPQKAQSELDMLFNSLEKTDPDPNRGTGIDVMPLRVQVSGNTRLALYVLFASTCLLLFIACANVANLILARGVSRADEIALRAALGASRGRIIQQLLTECIILGGLAGLFSLPVAFFSLRVLIAMGPPDIPRLQEAGINLTILVFTFTVALLSSVIFGMAPAMKAWHYDPIAQLKSKNVASSPIWTTNMRGIFIVAEFAFSTVLLTGAGLLIHSFLLVRAVDPGFEPEHVLNIHVAFPNGTSEQQISTISDSITERLQTIPSVTSVGGIEGVFDLGPANIIGLRDIDGQPVEQRQQWTALNWNIVRGDYFQTMGAKLLRGRYFSEEDGPTSPLVAIIDESMAHRYWNGESPIGKRIKGQDRRGQNDDWVTIIGVVGDIRTHGLERAITPHVYEWYRQANGPTTDFVVRTANNPDAIASELRYTVRSVAPTAILSDVKTVQQQLLHQLAPRRFQTTLLSLFSLLALVLATIGIYGLIHYSVMQRTHEIGIRMALGAERSSVMAIVLRQGLILAVVGLGMGLVLDCVATRLLSKLLYGVQPFDPLSLMSVLFTLLSTAVLACFFPAMRAASIDPMVALRSE